jgi:3-dehydroquinate dehydratase-2
MPGTILILNGPNLNMLGRREPGIYGTETLADIEKRCHAACEASGYECDFRQSNHEGDLVDWIQETALKSYAGLVINAGAYTHTSVAIHDALRLLDCPVAEVHLSDPSKREAFRHTSYVAPVACISIAGQGPAGYTQAIEALARKLAH